MHVTRKINHILIKIVEYFFLHLPGSFDPQKRTEMQPANTFECTNMAIKYKATREDVLNVYRKSVICKLDMILYVVFIVCLQC